MVSCIEMPNESHAQGVKRAKPYQNDKSTLPPTPPAQEEELGKTSVPDNETKEELETLRHALEEEKARSKEYSDRLKYLQADFENSVKRLRREADESARIGNEQMILKTIEVAENLERALEVGEKMAEDSELTAGVEMISKQLNEILRQEGLEVIPAEGRQFDPTLHEALAQKETLDKPDGTIVKELRRGYKLKGRVLRASKVEVARKPTS